MSRFNYVKSYVFCTDQIGHLLTQKASRKIPFLAILDENTTPSQQNHETLHELRSRSGSTLQSNLNVGSKRRTN